MSLNCTVSALTSEFQFVAHVTSGLFSPSLFIFTSSVYSSLPWQVYTWLACTIKWGGSRRLFHLSWCNSQWCSGEGEDTDNKYWWDMWMGVLKVNGPQWACHWWHVLSQSTLLRLPGDPQEHCPDWKLYFMNFPSLSHSGSQVLCKGTENKWICGLFPFQAQTAEATGWQVRHCPR